MDVETFKSAFLPHHRLLYSVAFRFMEDAMRAEDMVQELYAKLWDKRHELGEVNSYKAYAITVLRNLCLDDIRHNRNKENLDNEVEVSDNSSISKELEFKDDVRFLRHLINKLPDQQRQVIKLKHWDERSDQEIEQITGLSAVNIRVTLSRARKTIKEQFSRLR